MDPKLNKWLHWLDVIKADVQDLVIAKRTFQEVQQLIRNNPLLHQPSSFYDFIARTYVSHALIGLRRQLKCGDQSISLAGLFEEMIESPKTLTRTYFVGLYKGSGVESFADKDFNNFAAEGASHIDPHLVLADLIHIREASKRCEDYADKRIAHRDKREPKDLPTFGEVDSCIDLLDSLYVKQYLLFRGKSMQSLLPTRQFDWTAIFRIPWIAPDAKKSNPSLNPERLRHSW